MNTLIIFMCIISHSYGQGGYLTPQESNTRAILSLDGLWNFYLNGEGSSIDGTLSGDQNDLDLFLMPVPSSYNDIVTTTAGRDYLGPVTYERTFFVPNDWLTNSSKIWLRFGSVCYNSKVYVNGQLATTHAYGHLPFSTDITSFIHQDENTVKVIVDNILSLSTIPQGRIIKNMQAFSDGYPFNFFHYAGIDRSVILYKTPSTLISDVTLQTTLKETTGVLHYVINTEGPLSYYFAVNIYDQDGEMVYSNRIEAEGTIEIPNANLWWPYLMSDTPGYLYTFEVLLVEKGVTVDSYSQTFGFRELSWNTNNFLINGKPIYFRGFARYQDSDFRGRGTDLPIIVKDHNLLRWVGANSYRTINYPHTEEVMDLADRLGIMVIDETPAVSLINYTYPGILDNHKEVIQKLIKRDKNHPSVVLWSLAADPTAGLDGAGEYFKAITDFTKKLDSTRPITIPTSNGNKQDVAAIFTDIISINKYEAWQTNTGQLEVIIPVLVKELSEWHTSHNKPVLVTEYGCDSLDGFHSYPENAWSEEYQETLLGQHFEVFDNLRETGWFIGEMVNNFADFKSPQTIMSVGGSRKGVFSRQRQPKSSAFVVRRRYWNLAEELNNVTIPTDLNIYSTKKNKVRMQLKEEL